MDTGYNFSSLSFFIGAMDAMQPFPERLTAHSLTALWFLLGWMPLSRGTLEPPCLKALSITLPGFIFLHSTYPLS